MSSDRVLSPFAPDPFPYSFLIYVHEDDGSITPYGFVATPGTNWQTQQVNQRATRLQVGDRTIHDMSLRNLQVWNDLSRGGMGAKVSGDGTRYAWSENVCAADSNEAKLSPASVVCTSFLDVGEQIVAFLAWPGPQVVGRAAGAADSMLLLVSTTPAPARRTRFWRIDPTASGATATLLSFWTTASVNNITEQALSVTLYKNRVYVAFDPTGPTPQLRAFRWDGVNARWALEAATNNVSAELLHADGKWLIRTIGNELYRSADPFGVSPDWKGPVIIGDGEPITGLTTYGSDQGRAIYVTTWIGLLRILEQDGDIKEASYVDRRPGSADDQHGIALSVVNNEIVWNFPRGLLRHTLGQTQSTSPWEDDGVPLDARGLLAALQDGVGGIYVASNPFGGGHPYLLRWQAGIWHYFAPAPTGATLIRGLQWTSRQYAATARLWSWCRIADRDQLTYLPLPTSTANYRLLDLTSYPASGTLHLPVFTSEFGKLDKSWCAASLDLQATTPGIGSAELRYRLHGEPDTTYHNAGTYSAVPRTIGGTSGQWVASQVVPHATELELGVQSTSIQVDVTIQRGAGAAYPGTGLVEQLGGTILPTSKTLLVWGAAEGGEDRPGVITRPVCDAACYWWDADHWERVPLDAALVSAAIEDVADPDRVYLAGRFWIQDAWTSVVLWHRITGEITAEASGAGEMYGLVCSGNYYIGWGKSSTNSYNLMYRATSGGAWATRCYFDAPVRSGVVLPDGVLLAGGFTLLGGTPDALTIDAAHHLVKFVVDNSLSTNPPICFLVSGVAALTVGDHLSMMLHGPTVYFSGGIEGGQRLWQTPLASFNATTPTPVPTVPWSASSHVGLANDELITAIMSLDGPLVIGLADGALFRWTGASWSSLVSLADSGPVATLHSTGPDLFAIGQWQQQLVLTTGNNVSPRLYVNQVLYIPAFDNPAYSNPTPVVERIALWYFELPPYLRAYTLAMEFADDTLLLDGTPHPLTASQQVEQLSRLVQLNREVTIVTADRSVLRGFLGGLRMEPLSNERDRDDAPWNWCYGVTVTLSEMQAPTDGPTEYRRP